MRNTVKKEKKMVSVKDILDGISLEDLVFDDISFTFTEEVFRVLEIKGMSQKDLAKKMNVSEAHISKILSGEKNITLKTIAKIALALCVDMHMKFSNKGDAFSWNKYEYNQEMFFPDSTSNWKKTSYVNNKNWNNIDALAA